MGRYLLNNKVYDTEKSKEIIRYTKPIKFSGLILDTYPKYRHILYQTPKGNFFVHVGEYVGSSNFSYGDKDYIELLSADEVKEILNQLNAIEKYKKIFNDLEEG